MVLFHRCPQSPWRKGEDAFEPFHFPRMDAVFAPTQFKGFIQDETPQNGHQKTMVNHKA